MNQPPQNRRRGDAVEVFRRQIGTRFPTSKHHQGAVRVEGAVQSTHHVRQRTAFGLLHLPDEISADMDQVSEPSLRPTPCLSKAPQLCTEERRRRRIGVQGTWMLRHRHLRLRMTRDAY
jgi:hypothetical protein